MSEEQQSTEGASESVQASTPSASEGQSASAQTTPTETSGADTSLADKIKSGKAQAAATSGVAPAYTPNYKFKVMDEEKEIEEHYRSIIKDAETEKKVREMHEKAYGLDWHKPRYEKLKAEHQDVSEKYSTIDKSLRNLSMMVQNKDLGGFFDALKIPKEMVYEYVRNELQKIESPPDVRAQLIEQEQIRRDMIALRQQNEELSQRYHQDSIQAKEFELNSALASPEVKSIASFLDSQMGEGSFRREVLNRGIVAFQTTGKDIPISQAVHEAVQFYSKFMPQQQAQTQVTQQASAPQVPTLPNVSGRSTSPIKGGPRSIDDLRKLAAQNRT